MAEIAQMENARSPREQEQGVGRASETALVRSFSLKRRQMVLGVATANKFGQVGVQTGSPQDRSLQGHEAAACTHCASKSLFLQRHEGRYEAVPTGS